MSHALGLLARDFATPETVGAARAAAFEVADPPVSGELEDSAADAHGHVDDLLAACTALSLLDRARR